jgi:hypothetical protein
MDVLDDVQGHDSVDAVVGEWRFLDVARDPQIQVRISLNILMPAVDPDYFCGGEDGLGDQKIA